MEKDHASQQEIESMRGFSGNVDGGLFADLQEHMRRFNPFRVLGLSEMEIRHSRMLAWLLDAKENHGIGDCFLRLLLKNMAEANRGRFGWVDRIAALCGRSEPIFFEVSRENHHMDICLESSVEKMVIVIENKINAGERESTAGRQGQLLDYKSVIDLRYPGDEYVKVFVFLTPDGRFPSSENIPDWGTMAYEHVLESLMSIADRPKNDEVKLFISQYVDTIKEDVMGIDAELQAICERIYATHPAEFDRMFSCMGRKSKLRNGLAQKVIADGVKRGALKEINDVRFGATDLDNVFKSEGRRGMYLDESPYAFQFIFRGDQPRVRVKLMFEYDAASNEMRKRMRDFCARNGMELDTECKCPTAWQSDYKQQSDENAFRELIDEALGKVKEWTAKWTEE